MKIRLAATAAVALTWCGALVQIAASQEIFPDEPGRDAMMLACTQCHSAGKMLLADLTKDDWEFVIYEMIGRGAPVHEEDLADLVKYLQDNFATDK